MATLAQKKRSGKSGGHDNKTAHRQAEEKKDSAAQRKVMRSAYLQTKMAVSTPGDTQEQEADRVADEVSRMPKGVARAADETAPPGSSQPENNAEQPQSLQTKISRMGEEPETARTKLRRAEAEKIDTKAARSEEENLATQLHRSAKDESLQTKLFRDNLEEANPKLMRSEEEATAQAKLHRQEEEPGNTETDAEATSPETPIVADETEQKIESLRGQGNPMADDIRQEMEGKLHADFSRVSIHTSGDADALCKQLSARAFTVGNDVFFAAGEYAPTTEAGRKLLAHELTHVVQQQKGVSRKIYRTNGTSGSHSPPPGVTPIEPEQSSGPFEFSKEGKRYKYIATPSPKQLHMPEVRIPNFKRRHRALHTVPVSREAHARPTDQRTKWEDHFSPLMDSKVEDKINEARRRGGVSDAGGEEIYFFKGTRNPQLMLFGNRAQLKEKAIFPFWDARQQVRSFQVDHCREDQLGGENDITNYELLDAGANGSSGSQISRQISNEISEAVSVFTSPYYRGVIGGGSARISANTSRIRDNYTIQFNLVRYDLGDVENSDRYWSTTQFNQGQHLNQFTALTDRELTRFGDPRRPLLYTSPNGGIGVRAPQSAGQTVEIWPRVETSSALTVDANDENHATLTVDAYKSSDNRSLQASYSGLTFHFRPVPGMENAGTYKCWALDKRPTLTGARNMGSGGVFQSLRLPGLSPVRIDELDIDPARGFVGGGKLLPSIPILSDADIDLVIDGSDVRLQKTFDFEEIDIPAPFEIQQSSITAFMGSRGLGVDGLLKFGITNIGDGEIQASLSTEQGFALNGQFSFDERIFGEGTTAQVRMGYANEQWSMGGTITIPEGKVPGVTSATIDVNYSEGDGFSARGDATLDIPGVESGTIEITQSEEAGFSIGGTFNLSPDAPGIRGGSISVTLTERPDGTGYALSATGEAQPDIPGINSNLIVSYNDGAFTAEIEADYSRGMLSGRVNAGVTNRSVNEDGQTLSETAEPDNPLIVYGGGSLSLQLAPWLQATAGVQFSPNGEITVTGEIGLPDELEIFARREINKSIFNIAVQAPIFPGIVAEIGGGLSATAGIGPGVIDQLRLGVTYNPDHEEDTHITGDAHLNIPANAGLRLSVRAGIGLGITGASATGGLDIGGTLGIEGAAEAGVHVDWTPATGLDIEAEVAVHAQPSFTFDIGGYVSVRALGFSVYDERWEFASYTFGSDYRFGIRLPIHYREGEPFDISLDDVEFEVPDIDTNQLLRGLVARIA